MLAVAEPGSGKTLGYLLPALSWLVQRRAEAAQQGHKRPAVLILVPTRRVGGALIPWHTYPASVLGRQPTGMSRQNVPECSAAFLLAFIRISYSSTAVHFKSGRVRCRLSCAELGVEYGLRACKMQTVTLDMARLVAAAGSWRSR